MEKVYRSIDEQIKILKNKKIKFKDENQARIILLKENYYHVINGYKSVFLTKNLCNELFNENVFFEEIYSLYVFDRNLRSLVLKYILIIENNIKSYISNVFSRKYGYRDYLKKENFISDNIYRPQIEELFSKIDSTIKSNISNSNKMIVHYNDKYGYIPLWVLVRIITLGNISKFYRLLKLDDKKEIASLMNVHYNDLSTYLKQLSIARNICAHDEVLFNVRFDVIISSKGIVNILSKMNIPKNGGIYTKGINDLFSIIIILNKLLSKNEFYDFINEFSILLNRLSSSIYSINFSDLLDLMGVPSNYLDIL